VSGLMAGFEGLAASLLAFQPGQREFNVLAGAQRVGGEVGAAAMVVARLQSANAHTVRPARLRVGDGELREERLLAEVAKTVFLFAPELAAQLALPVFQRHVLRFVQTRQFGGAVLLLAF